MPEVKDKPKFDIQKATVWPCYVFVGSLFPTLINEQIKDLELCSNEYLKIKRETADKIDDFLSLAVDTLPDEVYELYSDMPAEMKIELPSSSQTECLVKFISKVGTVICHISKSGRVDIENKSKRKGK